MKLFREIMFYTVIITIGFFIVTLLIFYLFML